MSSTSSRFVILVFAVVVATASAGVEAAQGEWDFAIAPYLWAAGMDGSIGIGEIEQEVDVSFGDIIDKLDFALMGHFDMRNERWMLSADLLFIDLEDEQDAFAGSVKAGLDMTLLEAVGGYRISRVLSVVAGARWVDMGTSLGYEGALHEEQVEVDEGFIDPLVGLHALAPLSDRWWVAVRGDVGGFGVGSELTWQAYANLGFRASDLISVVLGYHVIDMDYEDGRGPTYVNLDVAISGPQLGVAFTF